MHYHPHFSTIHNFLWIVEDLFMRFISEIDNNVGEYDSILLLEVDKAITAFEDHVATLSNMEELSETNNSSISEEAAFGEKLGLSIINKAGAFIDWIAQFLNKVGTIINKLLMTGLPLFNGLIKRAIKIRDIAKNQKETPNLETLSLKIMYRDKVVTPDILTEQFDLLKDISTTLLSKDKLDQFSTISQNVLEPFRGNLKSGKTDELVFIAGVLGFLTSPVVRVGKLLKGLSSVIAPNAVGATTDVVDFTNSSGISKTLLSGMANVFSSIGDTGSGIIKNFKNGKLDLSLLPKYSDVYSFCEQNKPDPLSMFVTYSSPLLLDNQMFVVKQYKNEIHGEMQGSVSDIGAKFTSVKFKKDKESSKEAKALEANQIVGICENIIEIFEAAKIYAKSFPVFYKTYTRLYKQISDIVMSYDDKRLRGVYVRHCYKNTMSMILGSMWRNCFGSDNRFIRYMLSISRSTLKYCEQSLNKGIADNPDE